MVTESFTAARSGLPGPGELIADALPPSPKPGSALDPVAASEYLTRVRLTLEALADQLAQLYPPDQWIWYTRRLSSDLFSGHLVTTQFADHGVLETLTGLSRNQEAGVTLGPEGRTIFPFGVEDLRPVASMAAVAVALSQTHSWIRRAGKGTEFVVRSDDLPEPVLDADLEGAISVFDERVAADLQLHWHPALELNASNDKVHHLLGVTMVLGQWPKVLAWEGRLLERRWIWLEGQFHMKLMTLDGLLDTVAVAGQSGTRWWKKGTPSVVALLQSLWYEATFMSDSVGKNVPKVGYIRRKRDLAEHFLDLTLPLLQDDLETVFPGEVPKSGAQVLNDLESVGPDLWPIQPGPVARRSGDEVSLDIWAASARLHHDLLIPPQTGGEIVNATAFRFERVVQDRIDKTPWVPSANARALTRGHLKLNGKTLTDIDAVAEKDGVLLLISCKNLPFSPAYDAGEYRVIRNVASTVDNGVEFWRKIVQKLRSDPTGDNYDVSTFDEVHGVLVTPHTTYSRDSQTLRLLPIDGLTVRAAASLGELLKALDG
ncbi:hypothetical protein [Nocardioides panacisoli]